MQLAEKLAEGSRLCRGRKPSAIPAHCFGEIPLPEGQPLRMI